MLENVPRRIGHIGRLVVDAVKREIRDSFDFVTDKITDTAKYAAKTTRAVKKKVTSKDLYALFPLAPSKQGNKIAGLPYVARKGGY